MENIDKLPILKTAWVANKEFFKQFVKIKVFLFFFLPCIALYGVSTYFDLEKSRAERFVLKQVALLDSAYRYELFKDVKGGEKAAQLQILEGDLSSLTYNKSLDDTKLSPWLLNWKKAMTSSVIADHTEFKTNSGLLSLLLLICGSLFVVVWHRSVILNQPASINPLGKFKLCGRYILKAIVYGIAIALAVIPVGVVFWAVYYGYLYLMIAAGGLNLLTGFVMILAAIVAGFVLVKWWFFVYAASFVFPAVSVGKNLGVLESYRLAKKVSGRLMLTMISSSIVPFVFIILVGVVYGFVGSSSLQTEAVSMVVALFLGAGTLWLVLSQVGVLSIFYMHYIVPQLPALEKAREEKLLQKTGGNKPSSDE